MDNYSYFMKKALEQANHALSQGEFPVGCVIVYKDKIVADGMRTGTAENAMNEIDHAEINALRRLADIKDDIKRSDLTLFCTLEPCLMCFGAILLSGIGKIVYAYEDVMGGGTRCNLNTLTPLYRNNPISVIPNILRKESLELFRIFFANPHNNYWKGSLLSEYTLKTN